MIKKQTKESHSSWFCKFFFAKVLSETWVCVCMSKHPLPYIFWGRLHLVHTNAFILKCDKLKDASLHNFDANFSFCLYIPVDVCGIVSLKYVTFA